MFTYGKEEPDSIRYIHYPDQPTNTTHMEYMTKTHLLMKGLAGKPIFTWNSSIYEDEKHKTDYKSIPLYQGQYNILTSAPQQL